LCGFLRLRLEKQRNFKKNGASKRNFEEIQPNDEKFNRKLLPFVGVVCYTGIIKKREEHP
jgi:hypothetical protein